MKYHIKITFQENPFKDGELFVNIETKSYEEALKIIKENMKSVGMNVYRTRKLTKE